MTARLRAEPESRFEDSTRGTLAGRPSARIGEPAAREIIAAGLPVKHQGVRGILQPAGHAHRLPDQSEDGLSQRLAIRPGKNDRKGIPAGVGDQQRFNA
jgi:hypothetical protein